MALATAEAIRDQVYTLIEALTPTSLSDVKFRRYRNEWGANFVDAAEQHATAALRRVQVREVGEDGEPDVSNSDLEAVETIFEIRIAYPQTHRYGAGNAMDRDDVAKQDWKQLKHTLGCDGRANFSSTNDCTPLGATREREEGNGVDFSVIRMRVRYQRATT